MPSVKRKPKRKVASAKSAKSVKKSRASAKKATAQFTATNERYLDELLKEGKLLVHLQHKQLSGKVLSPQELRVLAALRLKCETIENDTRQLEEASVALKAAAAQRDEVRTVCATLPAATKGDSTRTTQILRIVDRDYRSALKNVKAKLLALLEQDWVVHTLLAIGAAGAVGWLGHRAVVSTAGATTELLREANQMTQTIHATTELIQATSQEGAKWTFSAMGGAVGAANGLLLGALLPGNRVGASSASALTAAAMGMYAGWKQFT